MSALIVRLKASTDQIVTVLAILAVLTTTLVAFSPGSTAAQIYCAGRTRHWSVSSGSFGPKVGWAELRVEVCTDGNSITSTSSSIHTETTGPGDAANFDVNATDPAQTAFNSGDRNHIGYTRYSSRITDRECAPFHAGNVCSLTENVHVWLSVRMLVGYIWAPASNRFKIGSRWFQWNNGHYCTTKLCTRLS